eukprot:TRINITY_DN6968_c0_g1_i2.p1 TRINITY_DN6968_c0_g1~~TRINITY_DN6968_c0_g1_i2.p1  ORF type:complete len:619 (+),score=235.73 TRINITY_DN6968_c0_g1_i2:98-1954(+)
MSDPDSVEERERQEQRRKRREEREKQKAEEERIERERDEARKREREQRKLARQNDAEADLASPRKDLAALSPRKEEPPAPGTPAAPPAAPVLAWADDSAAASAAVMSPTTAKVRSSLKQSGDRDVNAESPHPLLRHVQFTQSTLQLIAAQEGDPAAVAAVAQKKAAAAALAGDGVEEQAGTGKRLQRKPSSGVMLKSGSLSEDDDDDEKKEAPKPAAPPAGRRPLLRSKLTGRSIGHSPSDEDATSDRDPEPARLAAAPQKHARKKILVNTYGVPVDGETCFEFDLTDETTTIESVVIALVRRMRHAKTTHLAPADFSVLLQNGQHTQPIGLDQPLQAAFDKGMEIFHVRPKTAIFVQGKPINDGRSHEEIFVDLTATVLNVLSSIGVVLGMETENLMLKKVGDKEPYLKLKKTLEDSGVTAGSTLVLVEDLKVAPEKKKSARSKGLFGLKKKDAGDTSLASVSNAISLLRHNPTSRNLGKIQSCLLMSELWRSTFSQLHGLSLLFEVLSKSEKQLTFSEDGDSFVHYLDQCICCIETVVHPTAVLEELERAAGDETVTIPAGMQELLTIPFAARKLVFLLDPASDPSETRYAVLLLAPPTKCHGIKPPLRMPSVATS